MFYLLVILTRNIQIKMYNHFVVFLEYYVYFHNLFVVAVFLLPLVCSLTAWLCAQQDICFVFFFINKSRVC